MLNHQHLLLTADVEKPPQTEIELNNWLVGLVEKIDMEVLMGPYSVYLNEEGNNGITGVVVIKTSHISIHVWDECKPARVQMDVYSCKDFRTADVLEHLNEFELKDVPFLKKVDRNV